jgi:hypothetical protein
MMAGILLLAMAVAGCGSSPPPLQTESSTSAIRAAQEAGANDVPQASLHLQLAKEELVRAEEFSAQGRTAQASSQLLRAEADAELAILLSHEQTDKLAAIAAMERVRQLQRSNQ